MSVNQYHRASDSCMARKPAETVGPPFDPPVFCLRPEGHDGAHSRDRNPGPLSRTWPNLIAANNPGLRNQETD